MPSFKNQDEFDAFMADLVVRGRKVQGRLSRFRLTTEFKSHQSGPSDAGFGFKFDGAGNLAIAEMLAEHLEAREARGEIKAEAVQEPSPSIVLLPGGATEVPES